MWHAKLRLSLRVGDRLLPLSSGKDFFERYLPLKIQVVDHKECIERF
jgi:hypothetical protein